MSRDSRFATPLTRFAVWVAIAIVMSAGSVVYAAGQGCPASPTYTPDFSSNQSCIRANGTATFAPGTGTTTVLQLTTSSGNQTGSAWYNTPQVVQGGFTTSFQFQFTNPSTPPADGIAFVIQNAGTGAIGYAANNGGALGYGDDDDNSNPSTGEGIPNSLAVEFDSFQNTWDPQPGINGVSHVAIQSCGTGRNTSHHLALCNGSSGPSSTLGQPVLTSNFADGNMHNVTIQYFPACPTCNPATVANIQVLLDGNSVYPNGVPVDLSSIGLGNGGTAYVGFTGATGSDFETHNILNWTFGQTQQGMQITSGSGLTQTFVSNNTPGNHVELDFDYSTANTNGNLVIQPDTTPFVTPAGISPFDWATIVNGTTMADAPCLIANGQSVCVVNTLTCTTSANNDDTGTNCPQSNVRNVLFTQEIDLAQDQPGISKGILTIPQGYAPGMAMAPDALVSGAECNFPSGGGLASSLCPQSILTQIEDPTVRTGGTATTSNSTYVFFCCAPEWQTTPNIP
ncbi:MAG: L-type lectin-domain containing protein, partial [Candidatus Sulfotelmatobacter sp.]